MDWSTLPFITLRLALLLAGLLVPGSMLLRALRLPWSLAAAFAASCATLYAAVLVFAWTGAPITLFTLAAALGLVAVLARLVPARATATPLPSSFSNFTRLGTWLPLYLVFWLVVAYRLGFHPLNGPDVSFRWSWLAEQMLRFRTLDFYPPRSGEDFVRYFWAESIPPGIASLYAWAYACGGSAQALWTSPVVALQLLSTHEIIWRLASHWGGEAAARRAVLLAAACPLLTWSFVIGQETGQTALAVAGLAWCLYHLRDKNGNRWAVLAGLFALVASSCREYGPVFPLVAVVCAYRLQASRRQIQLLVAVTLPLALAWPLRVWMLTGNPFFSLNVAGLFPVNPVFTAWNDTFRGPQGLALGTLDAWLSLGRYFLLWALPAVAGLCALILLLVQRLREARILAVFVALAFALWFASVAYTAGGLFYSLRVLSPAFALLVVVAGYGLGRLPSSPLASRIATLALALLLTESLPKTLVLPENPYRTPASEWLQVADQFPARVRAGEQELAVKLSTLPDRKRILSDAAGLPRALAPCGMEVAPLWSPEIAWLFDEHLNPALVARHWQASGLRYLVLGKSGPTANFMQTKARWRAPYFSLRTVAETETHIILEATIPLTPP